MDISSVYICHYKFTHPRCVETSKESWQGVHSEIIGYYTYNGLVACFKLGCLPSFSCLFKGWSKGATASIGEDIRLMGKWGCGLPQVCLDAPDDVG